MLLFELIAMNCRTMKIYSTMKARYSVKFKYVQNFPAQKMNMLEWQECAVKFAVSVLL